MAPVRYFKLKYVYSCHDLLEIFLKYVSLISKNFNCPFSKDTKDFPEHCKRIVFGNLGITRLRAKRGRSIVYKLAFIFLEESKYLVVYKLFHLKYRNKGLPRYRLELID